MTREEAIDWLKAISFVSDKHITEALNMAIEALHREEAEEKGYCHRIRPSNVEVVVRCKDCRHAYFKDFDKYCPYVVGALKPDGYCHHGERREP